MMKEEILILTLFCLGSLAKTILDPNDYRNYAGMRTKKKDLKQQCNVIIKKMIKYKFIA